MNYGNENENEQMIVAVNAIYAFFVYFGNSSLD